MSRLSVSQSPANRKTFLTPPINNFLRKGALNCLSVPTLCTKRAKNRYKAAPTTSLNCILSTFYAPPRCAFLLRAFYPASPTAPYALKGVFYESHSAAAATKIWPTFYWCLARSHPLTLHESLVRNRNEPRLALCFWVASRCNGIYYTECLCVSVFTFLCWFSCLLFCIVSRTTLWVNLN